MSDSCLRRSPSSASYPNAPMRNCFQKHTLSGVYAGLAGGTATEKDRWQNLSLCGFRSCAPRCLARRRFLNLARHSPSARLRESRRRRLLRPEQLWRCRRFLRNEIAPAPISGSELDNAASAKLTWQNCNYWFQSATLSPPASKTTFLSTHHWSYLPRRVRSPGAGFDPTCS